MPPQHLRFITYISTALLPALEIWLLPTRGGSAAPQDAAPAPAAKRDKTPVCPLPALQKLAIHLHTGAAPAPALGDSISCGHYLHYMMAGYLHIEVLAPLPPLLGLPAHPSWWTWIGIPRRPGREPHPAILESLTLQLWTRCSGGAHCHCQHRSQHLAAAHIGSLTLFQLRCHLAS